MDARSKPWKLNAVRGTLCHGGVESTGLSVRMSTMQPLISPQFRIGISLAPLLALASNAIGEPPLAQESREGGVSVIRIRSSGAIWEFQLFDDSDRQR